MSKRLPMPITEALPMLRKAIKEGRPKLPAEYPQTLDRKEISRLISVFQPRQLEGRLAEDEAHIRTLVQAVGTPERPKYLDPVTVWWGGDRWYVIDGHHRLVAYKRAGINSRIPVTVFEGNVDEAMAQSAAANSKDRLIMRQDDKMNFAWRLTLVSDLSKQQVVDACSVSYGSVGNMRKVKSVLLENGAHTIEELLNTPWKDAQSEAVGLERDENFSPEDAVKKRAVRYREAIYRALGSQPFTDPEAFALALADLDSRFPERLMQSQAWFQALRQTVKNIAHDFAEAAEIEERWGAFDSDEY